MAAPVLARPSLWPRWGERRPIPRCRVSRECWERITAELDRVYPCEGLVVPLAALRMRRPEFNPCSMIELEDIEDLLVARTILVPWHRQINTAGRVSVLAQTDRAVNDCVERLVGQHPRLRACAYLHSHPFACGSTRPSRGQSCDYEGHMLPLLERNRNAGLNTSFSFIACRDRLGIAWKLHAFALDGQKRIMDLGFADVVSEDGAQVREALRPALQRRPEIRCQLRRWRKKLRRRGLRFAMDDLFGGSVRTVVHLDESRALVVLIPIDFPEGTPSFFSVRKKSGDTETLDVPGAWLRTPDGWSRIVDQARKRHPSLLLTIEGEEEGREYAAQGGLK